MYLRYLVLAACVAASAGLHSESFSDLRPEISAELDRATELEHRGNLREAERVVLNVIKATGSDPATKFEHAVSLNNLAVLYMATDRYSDAEQQFTRALRVLKTVPGPMAEQVAAKTTVHLAALYIETGRAKEARRLNPHALVEVLQNPDDKVRAKSSVAGLAMLEKDLGTAEKMFVEILSHWREPSRVDASQMEIATVLNNLAVIALWQGRLENAQLALEESFAAWKRILGPTNPTLAKAMTNVAAVCMQLKQYDEAVKWLARAEEIARNAFGELHPFTVHTLQVYADALKKSGRKVEAREKARSASEARRSMRSPSIADYTVDYRDFAGARPRTH